MSFLPPFLRPVLDDTARAGLPGSFVRLSRGVVRYRLEGPKEGPLAILVPGLSVPLEIWDRTVPALIQAGVRTLRFDAYGRGFSDRPWARYDLDLFATQIEELVAALELPAPAALVGFSMGGAVAAAAALRPSLGQSVVLVDPLVRWPRPRGMRRLWTAPVLGDALQAFLGTYRLAHAQRSDFFDAQAFQDFLPRYLPQGGFRGFPRAVLATLRRLPSWPLASVYEALGRAGIPVLVAWGREDATIPLRESTSLLAQLPQARFLVLDEAGHAPQWERPTAFNEALIEFLRDPERGGGISASAEAQDSWFPPTCAPSRS